MQNKINSKTAQNNVKTPAEPHPPMQNLIKTPTEPHPANSSHPLGPEDGQN